MARKRRWGEAKRTVRAGPRTIGPVRIITGDLFRTRSNHIHGRLRIQLGERDLPHMGFFGPGDVCLHTWASALRDMLATLGVSESARFVYDDGEEGMPAFEFLRQADTVYISVVDSALSDGLADRRWQKVGCFLGALQEQTRQFLRFYDDMTARDWPGVERHD